jgi:cell division protein ZapA
MPRNVNYFDITLLGKEYRVVCQEEGKDALVRAVAYIDGRMREIAEKTRGNSERVAVMMALNVTHEFLCLQDQLAEVHQVPARDDETGLDFDDVKRRITLMEARLDAVLEPQDRLI